MSKYACRKNWFLTYSQVTEQQTKEDLLAKLKEIDDVCDFAIGEERHQDGGLHYHAYVKFVGGVAPRDVLKFKWGERTAHAKAVRGLGAVVKYVIKDGKYISNIANIENYGKNHARKLTEFLLENGVDKAVEEGEVSIRGLKRLRGDVSDYKLHSVDVEPTIHCKGIWIHGPTGAGKTTEALQRFPDAFRKPPTKWWDGYEGQEVVLLDDLRKEGAKYIVYYLTQWMDKHPPPAGEVKGGNVPLPFKWFVVTSQWSIAEMFDDPRDRDAIERRCQGRIHGYVEGREVYDPEPARSINLAEVREYDVVPTANENAENVEMYNSVSAGDGGAESASAMSHNGMRAWQ